MLALNQLFFLFRRLDLNHADEFSRVAVSENPSHFHRVPLVSASVRQNFSAAGLCGLKYSFDVAGLVSSADERRVKLPWLGAHGYILQLRFGTPGYRDSVLPGYC